MVADGSTGRGEERGEPVLITAARRSYDDEHRARVRRYAILMSIRIPALVIAAIVFSLTRSPWIALGIIALSIPLPWCAVLIANDRPAQKPEDINTYQYGSGSHRPEIEPVHRNVIDG